MPNWRYASPWADLISLHTGAWQREPPQQHHTRAQRVWRRRAGCFQVQQRLHDVAPSQFIHSEEYCWKP